MKPRNTAKRPALPKIKLAVMRLSHSRGLDLPSYQTLGAAGMDLLAAVANGAPQVLAPGGRALVPTGLAMALPANFEAQVRPRSGLALNHGVTVLNAPGTIDADYRGEIQVLLINLGNRPFVVTRGMRIAQMVIAPVTRVVLEERPSLTASARGKGGFGSTGVKPATKAAVKSKAKKTSSAKRPASKAAKRAAPVAKQRKAKSLT